MSKSLVAKLAAQSNTGLILIFFGHQVSAHLVDNVLNSAKTYPVDNEKVPLSDFGTILGLDD